MEYDAELAQGSCLYNTLEGYLSRCKHGLHDDSLIEHYETIYQNNFLYYNKILALLKRTLDTSKENVERVSAVIDNDVNLKEGIHVEIERLHEKCDHAAQQIKLLEEQTDEVIAIVEGYKQQDLALEQSLTSVSSATMSTEEQIVLSYYALSNVKATVTRIQSRINAALGTLSKKERGIEVQQNVDKLLLADLEGLMHQHQTEVKRLNHINVELANENIAVDKEYTELTQKRNQIKIHIGSLVETKQRTESALSALEVEIQQLSVNIARLKEELVGLENKVATKVDRLTTATDTKQRIKRDEAALSSEITQLAKETEAIEMLVDKVLTKTTIEEQEIHIKQLEETYISQRNELDRVKALRSKHIAGCNTLRMQIDEMITLFGMKSISRLNVARELLDQRAKAKHGALGFHDLQQLKSLLQGERIKLAVTEKDLSQQIESATLDLRNLIKQHDALSTDLDATKKRTLSLNEEISRLREELDHLTSKEDQRVQMKVDLIGERDYISKSIEELKINDQERKAVYTKQVRDQIEAHKLRLKQLKSDDSSYLAEIIDEETKNSNILLNAALESLDLENAKEMSKLEAKHNEMMVEENEKFEAIRKVNASEISRLRGLIEDRRSRMKEAAMVPAVIVTKLPEEATMIPQPNDMNVRFKTPTPSNTTPSNLNDRLVSPASAIKKEVRRKCIRRSSTKTEDPKSSGEDELDLFC